MAATPDELDKMKSHVLHHWRQTCNCVLLLRSNVEARARDRLRPGEWTAWIDSFAMNARALIDFLYKKRNADDIGAMHYISTPWPKDAPAELEEIYKKASKTLAHVTLERLQPPYCNEWLLCDVVEKLRRHLVGFQTALVASGKHEWDGLGKHPRLTELIDATLWPRHGGSATNTADPYHQVIYGSTGFPRPMDDTP